MRSGRSVTIFLKRYLSLVESQDLQCWVGSAFGSSSSLLCRVLGGGVTGSCRGVDVSALSKAADDSREGISPAGV